MTLEKNNIKEWKTISLLIIFSAVFVFFNSKCSPLYLFNEWGDPNVYFSMGKGAVNGQTIYKDIFDHKGPFIFFIYAIGYLISDNTFTGIYILEIIALFINLLYAYKLSHLYISKQGSFFVALIFTLFLFNKTYFGGSAEEFISPVITASLYYFICYFRVENLNMKQRTKIIFAQGIFLGLVLLTKLNICIFWIPMMITIGIRLLYGNAYKEIVKYVITFIGGIFIVSAPFIIYFTINNAIFDFYFAYIKFNSLYAEFSASTHTVRLIVSRFGKQIFSDYISFTLTLFGVAMVSFTKIYVKDIIYRTGILLSFILSYTMIVIVPYVMTYALIIIYMYALFGVIFIFRLINRYIKAKEHLTVYLIGIIAVLIGGIYQKQFFGEEKDCLMRKSECNYMQKEFATIINKEEAPTLLDLGLDHGVFTKANIVPKYKYFFSPNIPYSVFPGIIDYQTNLIKKKEPKFLIFGNSTPARFHFESILEKEKSYALIDTYKQNIGAFDTEVYLYKRIEE